MPSYVICVEAVISLSTEVAATSLEDAVSAAQRRGVRDLCHQCAGGDPASEWVTSGELDCDPAISTLSSVTVDGEDVDLGAVRACWEGG